MDCQSTKFSDHAILKMFQRSIGVDDVESIIKTGEVIRSYPEDKPYPSVLLLGYKNQQPIHVVVAQDETGNCIVITTYVPDLNIWKTGFRNKK
jgi:hypothetical protein